MKRMCLTAVLAAMGLTVVMTADAKAQWFPNPVIGNTGQYVSGSSYNPWNNRWTVRTDQHVTRASAMDPWRGYADPGSRQYVNRVVRNASGNLVREHGWTWTTGGQPHGSLTRSGYQRNPWGNVDTQSNTTVHYSRR